MFVCHLLELHVSLIFFQKFASLLIFVISKSSFVYPSYMLFFDQFFFQINFCKTLNLMLFNNLWLVWCRILPLRCFLCWHFSFWFIIQVHVLHYSIVLCFIFHISNIFNVTSCFIISKMSVSSVNTLHFLSIFHYVVELLLL